MAIAVFTPYKDITLIYFPICGIIIYVRNRAFQLRENQEAQNIFDQLQSTEYQVPVLPNVPFAIYLRPFLVDQDMRSSRISFASQIFGGFAFTMVDRHSQSMINSEVQLSNEIQSRLKLKMLTIAEPNINNTATQSAGLVYLGDDWKRRIRALIDNADLIVKIPSLSPGSRFEYEYITSSTRLMEKTLFVIPPCDEKHTSKNIIYGQSLELVAELWKLNRLSNLGVLKSGGRVVRFVSREAFYNPTRSATMRDLITQTVAMGEELHAH